MTQAMTIERRSKRLDLHSLQHIVSHYNVTKLCAHIINCMWHYFLICLLMPCNRRRSRKLWMTAISTPTYGSASSIKSGARFFYNAKLILMSSHSAGVMCGYDRTCMHKKIMKMISRNPKTCNKCGLQTYVGSATCTNDACVQTLVWFKHYALQWDAVV
jgi:hypothetical protein